MDCITCHNRITHLILPPEDAVDQLLTRTADLLATIPEIRLKAVEVFRRMTTPSPEVALSGIAGLDGYYRTDLPRLLRRPTPR